MTFCHAAINVFVDGNDKFEFENNVNRTIFLRNLVFDRNIRRFKIKPIGK